MKKQRLGLFGWRPWGTHIGTAIDWPLDEGNYFHRVVEVLAVEVAEVLDCIHALWDSELPLTRVAMEPIFSFHHTLLSNKIIP